LAANGRADLKAQKQKGGREVRLRITFVVLA
jgi:hypothetical protein